MENGVLALQCPKHDTYHVQADSVIVEILDEGDQPCKPGEIGRVVVTDLHNFATPFIRYELGDYAERGEACPCGRTLPVLTRILGRTRNMLSLPNNVKIYPLLSRLTWPTPELIRQFQIIQHSLNEIEVKVTFTGPAGDEDKAGIIRSVDAFFKHRYQVRLSVCDEIARSPSGKFEDFQSLIA